jgi:hypothetical protein
VGIPLGFAGTLHILDDLAIGNDQSDLHLLLDEGGTLMGIIVISWPDFWLRGGFTISWRDLFF